MLLYIIIAKKYNYAIISSKKEQKSMSIISTNDEPDSIDQAIYESEQELLNGAEAVDADKVFSELEKKITK